ncbi:unnamed protein product [Prorocentrum cordatum]|uniref:Uncharacterized protein n=1 Tax=Prorocentrum cordatum TaxID=2364126 RepID=A0ABN9VZV7_9DINO|nr:unnamed protein product [Polarella glacialis]
MAERTPHASARARGPGDTLGPVALQKPAAADPDAAPESLARSPTPTARPASAASRLGAAPVRCGPAALGGKACRRLPSASYWSAQLALNRGAFDRFQAPRPRRAFSPPPRGARGGGEAPLCAAGPGCGGRATGPAAPGGQAGPLGPQGPGGAGRGAGLGVEDAGPWAGSPALALRRGLARVVTV